VRSFAITAANRNKEEGKEKMMVPFIFEMNGLYLSFFKLSLYHFATV